MARMKFKNSVVVALALLVGVHSSANAAGAPPATGEEELLDSSAPIVEPVHVADPLDALRAMAVKAFGAGTTVYKKRQKKGEKGLPWLEVSAPARDSLYEALGGTRKAFLLQCKDFFAAAFNSDEHKRCSGFVVSRAGLAQFEGRTKIVTAATAVLPAEVGRNAAWPMSTAELAAMLESKGALLSR